MPGDEERKIAELEQDLRDIEAFEKDIVGAINDEQEAQRLYEQIGANAKALSVKLWKYTFGSMAVDIGNIKEDEAGHERKFDSMLVRTRQHKQNLIDEIQRCRDKSQEDLDKERRIFWRPGR